MEVHENERRELLKEKRMMEIKALKRLLSQHDEFFNFINLADEQNAGLTWFIAQRQPSARHAVPDEKKYEIVNNMLDKLPKGSKAVFVDYHNPAKWQPIRYILKLVNHYLEPFAEALWNNELCSYATHADRFTWRKKTFFGGVYQCVVVEHKD